MTTFSHLKSLLLLHIACIICVLGQTQGLIAPGTSA